jgi:methionyl-tRNA synthetase
MSALPDRFYLTTPIYYVNDRPHIGHAYTTLLADVLARYHRLLGVPTHLLTGTDEHGQKVLQAAKQAGCTPQQQADRTVVRFQEMFSRLQITHDDFIRTTEPRHTRVVQHILAELNERGEIYSDSYSGWYSVYEESFFTEKDLIDGKDPIGGRDVEWIEEKAYFFRMGKYQPWLIEHIENNPDFIQPEHRRNETLGFLKQPLSDLCISRPKARMSWGIELPFDPDYVCYVWFDALVNYISAIGYKRDDALFQRWWPARYHLIGKDILTPHTVYWPTMLKALGLPLPQTIFAHGWWLVQAEKMSKSRGNAIDPMALVDKYGVEPFRYFLIAEMTLGQDASFSELAFAERYNADLAGDLGNMLSRAIKLVQSSFDGKLPAAQALQEPDRELCALALAATREMETALAELALDRGVRQVCGVVRACNKYFERTAPWTLAKSELAEDRARLGTVLRTVCEALRIAAGLLYPIMPKSMAEYRTSLGLPADALTPRLDELRAWDGLPEAAPVGELKALFPRIDLKALREQVGEPAAPAPAKKKAAPAASPAAENVVIDIDRFKQVELRTAKVLSAQRVERADRLLQLEIEVGDERRPLVAGIAQHYAPEDLVGRTIVIVANLKPAKIRGIESRGMLLAAKRGDALRLITVDGELPSGCEVG